MTASGGIDARQAVQVAAAGFEVAALGVEQTEAEGLAQPGPAVVGRAAADAHDHATRPGGDGRQQQLAGAPRGRDQGVALRRRHEHQPRGGRHLEHGGPTVAQQAETGDDRLAQRAGHLGFAVRAAGRGHQGLDGSLAAVGHRHLVDRCAGRRPGHAARHRRRGLEGCQAPLELVRGDHHPHRRRPTRMPRQEPGPPSHRGDSSLGELSSGSGASMQA